MNKIAGKVESMSKKGNSIKVNGEWYSVAPQAAATALKGVAWKDEVEFLYEQKGQYKNIKGVVTVVSGTGSPAANSSRGGNGGGYSNIGVEVGHAANLAMNMMEQQAMTSSTALAVGSKEYYQTFAQYTLDMYKVMKGIRSKIEQPVPVVEPTPPVVDSVPELEDGDIF